MQALRDNPRLRRLTLLGLVIVVLLCLVGVLIFNILTTGGEEVAGNTPTPTQEPTGEATVVITPEVTPTPTFVISEEPTSEPTVEPTEEAAVEPTTEPTAEPTTPPPSSDFTPQVSFEPGPAQELLKNGGFEAGFGENGVGLDWQSFQTSHAAVTFSSEAPGPYVKDGSSAQRITVVGADQPNRYAGIYQQVEVVPNDTYTLELHGQIRTGLADVNISSYGYRVQYAIDQTGGDNWQKVPEENWVEVQWDEQLLHSPNTKFLAYTTEIIPTADQITLFVRTWNKWADPGEVQYTLDGLSLVGPSLVRVVTNAEGEAVSSGEVSSGADSGGEAASPGKGTTGEETMVDNGLPVTGTDGSSSLVGDGRFWGALFILLLLGVGAIYRAKWSH